MIIGLLKEELPERRVALLPEAVKTLTGMNIKVLVEAGAGLTAFASDAEYEAAGAGIQTREGTNFDPFMAKELKKDGLQKIQGKFYEDKSFTVDLAELNEFEQQFPFKEKHITSTQLNI